MRFLIDECLHESLVGVAHGAGLEATHVNHLGLTGKPDWQLAERTVKDEFTFVTNNRFDFIRLIGTMELHAGLIIVVPNVAPILQRAMFEAAILYLGGRELVNAVLEVTLQGQNVSCTEYGLSKSQSRMYGGRDRTRTCDLLRVKQAL
jgi:predicted nuclease of predicted toxin-antitoxin system